MTKKGLKHRKKKSNKQTNKQASKQTNKRQNLIVLSSSSIFELLSQLSSNFSADNAWNFKPDNNA